jgi:hypothetical protein
MWLCVVSTVISTPKYHLGPKDYKCVGVVRAHNLSARMGLEVRGATMSPSRGDCIHRLMTILILKARRALNRRALGFFEKKTGLSQKP